MAALRVLTKLTRWLWLLVATVVIGYAVLVVLGRLMLPSLDNYRPQLIAYMSDILDAEMQMDRLSGTWPRLTPTLSADQVVIRSPGALGGIKIGRVSAELSPFLSLWQGQLIWRQLNLKQVELALDENAEGGWSLAGFPLGAGGGSIEPLEILLQSDLIQIDRVLLTLNFYSGTQFNLAAEDILVENTNDFHRTLASLVSPQGEEVASFVFEATGDHHQAPENFTSSGYLRLNRINTGGGLSAIARKWFPAQIDKIGNLKAEVDTEFWFDVQADGQTDIVGRLNAEEVPLNWAVDLPSLTAVKADLTGWYRPGSDWGVTLQSLDFDWGSQQIRPLNIRFGQRVGNRWGEFGLDISRISIDVLRELVVKSQLLPEKLESIINTINPGGDAEQISVDFSPSGDTPSILVRAYLQGISLDPYKGVPGARGVSGYLESSTHKGLFALDSDDISIHFASLFDQPIEHWRANGTLGWHWDVERSEVSMVSSPLRTSGEEGDVIGQFYLQLPVKRPQVAPQLFLQMGVRNSHSRYRDRFLPKLLDPKLTQWLQTAIEDTEIEQAGIIFRGSLRKGQRAQRATQLYLKANGGRLQYHPDWPALEDYAGQLLYNDGELQGQVDSGKMGDMTIDHASVFLDAAGDKKLAVKATGTAVAPAAFELLNSSPLREQMSGLADWQLAGQLDASADLQVPLGGDWQTGQYRVTANIRDGSLKQPEYKLAITDINGKLNYSLQKGLYARSLTASVLGLPVTAALSTVDKKLLIDVNGELQATPLAAHFGWQPGDLISGGASGRARVVLAGGNSDTASTIELESDLEGVVVNLPPPFAKAAHEKRVLKATLTLSDDTVVQAQYGHNVHAGAQLQDRTWRRGYLGINRSDLTLPSEDILMMAADISEINLVDWQSSALQMFDTGTATVPGLLPPIRFDVRVGELGVSDLKLPKAHLRGNLRNSVLHARLESPIAGGRLDVPLDNSHQMTIELDYLKLPEWQSGQISEENSFDPRTLRGMTFSVQDLSIGEWQLGRAKFELQSMTDGLNITNIDADLLGLKMGDENNVTSLSWRYDGNQHNTGFNGVLQTGEISKVLENFGLEAIVKSEKSVFQSDLNWTGRPWELNSETLAGQVSFALEKGNFYQRRGAATNAFMRIVGLFNFDTWLRRLRLDFSDLYKKGISYDNISGGLIFDRGTLSFPEPIIAKAPSGTIQMRGTVDMLKEQIDARLVATLPVGTNLPWVAALAVNLPAAAGVWVISKLFKKQVDNLSSISYRIEGGWEDPDIEVEKIFSDQNRAEKKKQKKARKKREKQLRASDN